MGKKVGLLTCFFLFGFYSPEVYGQAEAGDYIRYKFRQHQVYLPLRRLQEIDANLFRQFDGNPITLSIDDTSHWEIRQRVYQNVPVEGSTWIEYHKRGGVSRYWVRGEQDITTKLVVLTFDEARHRARKFIQFEDRLDKDLSNTEIEKQVYRLDESTQTFHLMYRFLFEMYFWDEPIQVVVDGITGNVVEVQPVSDKGNPVKGVEYILTALEMDNPLLDEDTDLRINRSFRFHKGKGDSVFEGQILGSTLWDLVVRWMGWMSKDQAYEHMQFLIEKSQGIIADQRDVAGIFSVLSDYPRCVLLDVFSRHDLAKLPQECETKPPLSEGQGWFSLWEDDVLLESRQVTDLSTLGNVDTFFSPHSMSLDHRYWIKTTTISAQGRVLQKQKELFLDRVKNPPVYVHQRMQEEVYEGYNAFYISGQGEGLINGPVWIKLDMVVRNPYEKVRIYLESQSGKKTPLVVHPEHLNQVNHVWQAAPYGFQGEPVDQTFKVIVIDDERYASGIVIGEVHLFLNSVTRK